MLTLAGAQDEEQRQAAQTGARWLLRRVDQWAGQVEDDFLLTQAKWWVLTASLGVRAIVATNAAAPDDARLRPALEALATLWDQEANAWVIPGDEYGSTTGSFGVLSAVRAATRTWRFDPFDGLPAAFARPSGPRRRTSMRNVLRLDTVSGRLTASDAAGGVIFEEELPPKLTAALAFVARRNDDGRAGGLARRSFALSELARDLGVADDSARIYIVRINAFVIDHGTSAFLTRVIEDVIPPGQPKQTGGARRYAIDQYGVEVR